jgi:hypothetical protein
MGLCVRAPSGWKVSETVAVVVVKGVNLELKTCNSDSLRMLFSYLEVSSLYPLSSCW